MTRILVLFSVVICTFPLAAQLPTFTATDISTSDYYDIAPADYDLDGDIDLATVNFNGLQTRVFYQTSGLFGSTPAISIGGTDHPKSIAAADINADGLPDLVVGSSFDDNIQWYPNNGSAFGAAIIIDNSAIRNTRLRTADLDADGDIDVISANLVGDELAWYENDGSGSTWTKHVVSSTVDGCAGVDVGDLDQDGDPDLVQVSGVDQTVSWFENDGAGNFGPEQIISSGFFTSLLCVVIADFDNNGNNDIAIMTNTSNQVAWFPAIEQGSFGSHIIISTAIDQGRRLDVGDIDNDGDIDLISASRDDGKFAWYENLGSGFGTQHIISDAYPGAYYPIVVDIDLDGDLDVVGSATTTGIAKLVVFENNLINICPEPVALNATPSPTGVLIEFDPDFTHTAWQLKGFVAGTSISSTINLSTPSWSTTGGLTPLTDYGWKVRAQCTGGLISDWTPLQTFSTPLRMAAGLSGSATVYPNPANDMLYVQFEEAPGNIALFSMNGQQLTKWSQSGALKVANIPDGQYFLLIEDDERQLVYPVVIAH